VKSEKQTQFKPKQSQSKPISDVHLFRFSAKNLFFIGFFLDVTARLRISCRQRMVSEKLFYIPAKLFPPTRLVLLWPKRRMDVSGKEVN
jgi:hypothetical protein